YAALDDQFGERPFTTDDLPKLEPARRVVMEAMRLYPPAWAVGRAVRAPIEVAGYDVPVGTQIYVLPWLTHRDPRFFEAPETFRPDRWRGDVNKKAYFPFGGGPRKCIGAHLATMEATLMIAELVRRFRFGVAKDHRLVLQPAVTLRPRHGIHLRIEPRPARYRRAS
ncbi:MAG: cytochrome P450, partial [Myxococcota bacterium]